MSEQKDVLSLRGILDAITRIESYVSDITDADTLYGDQKTFDAVCMNFIVLGEMVDRISPDYKQTHSDIDWSEIKALRNIIAHDYFGVDADEIWSIIHRDLLSLKKSISALLQ